MAGETVITIMGNLVDDPELRFTPSGLPVAKFRVASTPRTFDQQSNEWKDGDSLFLTCSVWRQAAEHCAESLQRGMRVIVVGRLKQRSYEAGDGSKRTVYELDVDEVGPSLKNATAKVTKASGSGGGREQFQQARQQQGQASAQDPWAEQPGASSGGGGGWGGSEEPPF
jgi:single-strand DNA-binding protein